MLYAVLFKAIFITRKDIVKATFTQAAATTRFYETTRRKQVQGVLD